MPSQDMMGELDVVTGSFATIADDSISSTFQN